MAKALRVGFEAQPDAMKPCEEGHPAACWFWYPQAMQVTVDIPDELADQVEARGLVLESYLRELIQTNLSEKQTSTEQRRNAVDAMRQFAAKYRFTTGNHDLKNMVHEGHKY